MASPIPIATHQVVGSSFGFFTAEEIRKISVKRIENPVSLSRLSTPIEGGLYDPALGPLDRDTKCVTCGMMEMHCPGHFGHIELPVPVYNPLIFSELLTLMKLLCFNCHHFRLEMAKTRQFVKILNLINSGDLDAVLRAVEGLAVTSKRKKKGEKEEDFEESGAVDLALEDLEITEEDMLRLRMTSNLNDFRNKIIHRFTREQPTLACGNCSAPRLPVGRDGHAKLFMKRHGPAKMRSIWATGARYQSVLYGQEEPNALVEAGLQSAEYDPIVKWLFYKDEENTHAYKAALQEETKKAAPVKSSKKKGEEKKIEVPEEASEITDRSIAAETAKSLPSNQRIMFANEVREHLRLLWQAEPEIVPLIWSSLFKGTTGAKLRRSDYNIFFLSVLPVPPNRFRPMGAANGVKSEHIQNTILSRLLTDCRALTEVVHPSATPTAKKLTEAEIRQKAHQASIKGKSELWLSIQTAVNDLVDNTLSNKLRSGPARPPGIKQIIEKKQGLFRQNMMGKRVDFAARSVISPDPYIATTEIGVPLYFAKGLNFPEPVTDYNVEMLRQMVINGPDVHPGANAVEDEHGNVVPLRGDPKRRRGLAATLQKPSLASAASSGSLHGVKKVHRHLIDGDVLIVNRQPTLHKPSMMVHKARVLGKENTIQMHYCNCNTYNADFDGDEMNLHLVQNEVARAEAHTIAINDNQYIVPKDGSPIRGLIQDHILSGVLLTQRDTFLTKEQFQQLLYYCCWDLHQEQSPIMIMPPPAILKPQPLWTGKQVISAMLDNLLYRLEPLNLTAKCAVPEEMWGKGSNEGVLIIRGNQLLTGSLGKAQFGAKPHGLVHSIYELYGPTYSAQLLTVLGRLLTHWLQFAGFTCGMDDTLLKAQTERERAAIRVASDRSGLRSAGIFLGLFQPDTAESTEPITEEEQAYIFDKLKQMSESAEEWDKWDKFMIGAASRTTSKIIDTCLPKGQIKPFPKNNLGLMTVSGAKGSRVNFSQISCLLGQQELEGKRVPLMVTGRSLPSFLPFDPTPRAGGYVTDRFLTGVRPQEYFFHCMAGREGLIDTAVKTSRSGYLQRCIVKHLESLVVQYDHTVRDAADGSVLQFRYGEDSVDVMKVSFMQKFDFFAENLDALLQLYDFTQAQEKLKSIPRKTIRAIHKAKEEEERLKTESKERVSHAVKELGIGIDRLPIHVQDRVEVPDPIMSTYMPGSTLGCISEKYEAALEGFIAANPDYFLQPESSSKKGGKKHSETMDVDGDAKAGATQISRLTGKPRIDPDVFRNAMYVKYIHCLTEAGEAVGVIAGQSIGEPSTQMTLNTFHLAGKGEVNVTLGIPRLRELIQTAGSIKTPSMTLPMHEHCTEKDAERLANRLYRLPMSELIERIQVTESLVSMGNNHARQYDVEVELKPFEKKWEITWSKLRSKTSGFVASLLNDIAKTFKMKRFFAGKDTMGFNWDSLGDVLGASGDGDDEDGDRFGKNTDDDMEASKVNQRTQDDEGIASEPEKDDSSSSSSSSDNDSSSSDDSSDSDSSDDDDSKSTSTASGAPSDSDSDDSGAKLKKKKKKSSVKDHVPKVALKKTASSGENAMDVDPAAKKSKSIASPAAAARVELTGSGLHDKKHKSSENTLAFLKGQSGYITAYQFDDKKGRFTLSLSVPADKAKLLLVSMIEKLAEKFVIREVAGIQKAAVLKGDKKNPLTRVQTAGINFAHIHRLARFIDVDSITTNDVQAVYRTYGIEAAREALRGEISAVFQAYGITVDPRHLTLVADYMTHTGEIRAMTRNGIATSASPFLKMSFESTTRFLASAASRGDYENMLSPSAAIVLGLAPRVGSGICDIRHNFAFTSDIAESSY
jgi:DNA-directed RNA polymerase I subunit RPA1